MVKWDLNLSRLKQGKGGGLGVCVGEGFKRDGRARLETGLVFSDRYDMTA